MSRGRLLSGALALTVATVALLPGAGWAQQAPANTASPAEKPSPGPRVPVRSGVHPDYSRLVFDWPREVPYTVEQVGTSVTVRFPVTAQVDLAAVLRAKPSRVNNLAQSVADGTVTVRFDIPAGAGIKHGRAGSRVVLDVLDKPPPQAAAKTAASATPPPTAAASPTPTPTAAPTPAASATPAPAPAAKQAEAKPADPRPAKEGAPLYQLRGNGAAAPAATGAPTPLVPAPPSPVQTSAVTPTPAASAPAKPAEQAAPAAAQTTTPPPASPTGTPPTMAAPPPATGPVPASATAAPTAQAAEPISAPVTLNFDPKVARTAAIFERAGYLYVLFGGPVPPETAPAVPPELQVAIEPVAVDGGGGFRLAMPAVLQARVRREGTGWQVVLSRTSDTGPASSSGPSILPRPDPDFALGPRLVVPAAEAERVIAFQDPVVGDTLSVVPLPLPGQRVEAPLRYEQVQFLPTLQGLVIRALDDRLAVQPVREGVEVTVPGGLRLSSAADIQASVPPPPPVVEQERLFDFKRWGQVPVKDYVKTRQARWDRLASLPDGDKTRGRLDVARFYLANGMGYEALGMLTRVQSQQPDVDRRPEFLAIRGLGRVMTGDYAGGMADLSNKQLAGEPDAALWRAAALAGQGDFAGAHAAFQASKDLLDRYPEPFYTKLALAAADSALHVGQPEAASVIMDRVAKRGGEGGDQATAVQYFRGAVYRALGDHDKALNYFKQARDGRDRLYAMRAKRDYIDTALDAGKMAPKDAAKQMEEMRFAWRGDALELSNLRRVGEVHAIAGNYPQAFDTMRHTITTFADTPEAKEVAAEMTRTFTDLFATDGAAKMSPLEAMALYEQYRELTPPGPDGDRIIRKLAERLVQIDLLDRAAQLLDHQVQYRLQGEEKAQIGTRLAGIRLLDGKPEEAVAALDKSNVPEIHPELAEERKLLRARALSQISKGAEAVQLLAADQSRDANLLRIDIAMRDKQWNAAAQALADVIGPPPAAGTTLDPAMSGLVVNRATALSLAGDNAGLDALRRDFGPAMEKSKDATFFRLLTRPEESAGLADANTIRQRITEIDLFRSFLEKYRADRKEAAPTEPATSSPTPPAANTPPAAPAQPTP